MLGLAVSAAKGGAALLNYVKDNLKLYLDFKSTRSDTLKFPCEGSTDFDSSDYIDCGDINDLDSASALTISAWVKCDSTSGAHVIVSKYSASSTRLEFILSSNVLYAVVDSGSSMNGNVAYTSTDWNHVAMVFDGSRTDGVTATQNALRLKIYLNGVNQTLSYTGTIGTTIPDTSTNVLKIGNRTSHAFDGKMANVAVWDRALSVEEINSVMRKKYNQLKSIEKTSLVSWWALDSKAPVTVTSGTAPTAPISLDSTNTTLGSAVLDTSDFSGWTYDGSSSADGNNHISFPDGGDNYAYSSGLSASTVYYFSITASGSGSFYFGENGGESRILSVGTGTTTGYFATDGSLGLAPIVRGNFVGTISHIAIYPLAGGNHGRWVYSYYPTVNDTVYGGNAPVLPRAVDVAREGEAEAIGNGSAFFDGADDYILSSSNINLDGGKSRTFSAWIRPDDNPSSGNIYDVLSYGAFSTSNYFEFGIYSDSGDGDTIKAWANLYGSDFSVAQTFTVGEWYHYAVVYTAINSTTGTLKLYINGILLGTSGTLGGSNSINTTNDQLDIGRRSGGSGYFDGDIAQLGAWAGALTQAQIQSVMESTSYATIPASVKSTLGAEEITNGDFATGDFTGWSGSTSFDGTNGFVITNGACRLRSDGTNTSIYQEALVDTKFYKLTFDITAITGSMKFVSYGNGESVTIFTTTGTKTLYFKATGTYTYFQRNAACDVTFDNISIKEVTNDLVGYWALDVDGSDSTENNNDGTLT